MSQQESRSCPPPRQARQGKSGPPATGERTRKRSRTIFTLRHFSQQVNPRHGALRRRRDRRLNAIRPSKANATWYYGTLNHEVVLRLRTLGTDVAHDLRNHWPPPKDAHDALDAKAPPKPKKSNPHEVTAAVDRARARFPPQVARGVAVHISTKLVKKNLDTVDDKLSASIKASLPGVDIRNMLMQHGPILDAMGDALEENVDLITSISAEQYFQTAHREDVISEAWEEGRGQLDDRWWGTSRSAETSRKSDGRSWYRQGSDQSDLNIS